MNKDKYILAVETSCDDTSIAVLKDYQVLSCVTADSTKILNNYGGIVPEIASRKHEEYIIDVYKKALEKANIKQDQIDYICYTKEPGLPGSLHVGEVFSQSVAYMINKKAYPVNHIHAHIFSSFINQKDIKYPFLSLIASGKTTSIFLVKDAYHIEELIKTNDDAVGETFDKIAKRLGLDYPGGPEIDKIFDINKATIELPKQNITANFSFSGIKSHIIRLIDNSKKNNDFDIITIASSFMKWAIELLIDKLDYFSKMYKVDTVCIGGGVSANSLFKIKIKQIFSNSYVPLKEYSCDNAAMIGYLFYQQHLNTIK